MKAVGFLCGVGSLLRVAQDEGFEVIGNVDPRTTFKTIPWLWERNFGKRIPYFSNLEDRGTPRKPHPQNWVGVDLAIGHPPCGKHSAMGHAAYSIETLDAEKAMRKERRASNVGMLPDFCQLVRIFKPKVFALDNLPKILSRVATSEWWKSQLPGYKFHFIIIKNWDYGCVQIRKRLWVVGIRRKTASKRLLNWTFDPISVRPSNAPRHSLDALEGLPWEPWIDIPEIGHTHHPPDASTFGSYWTSKEPRKRIQPVGRLAMGFLEIVPGHMWLYLNPHGRLIRKPGRTRVKPLGECCVITGRESAHHPLTGWGLTIRERARLMGWPDDFHVTDGTMIDRSRRYKLIEATGRAVPSEFPQYLIRQIADHF